MQDKGIHIAVDGDLLVVGFDPEHGPAGRTSITVDCAAFLTALFRALDAELAITASGQVTLTMDALDDDAEPPSGWLDLPRTVPIDALVAAMAEAVLAAPDRDDEAALADCIARLETALAAANRASAKLREGYF